MRHVIISFELRSTVLLFGEYLDHWKKVSLEHAHCLTIQRYIRGFLGRCRKRFIQRIHKKVLRIQSHSRQYMIKLKVNSYKSRLFWAASTIQRLYRGRKQRKMIGTMIEAYYDTRKRQLEKEKEQWNLSRLVRASIAIQMTIRRFLRRRRTMKHFQQIELQREIEDQMKESFEESKVKEEVYKQELTQWYIRRKEEHDELVMNEKQTAKERKKILDRKTKRIQEEKRLLAILRAEKLVKIEEERVEKWVKDWEIRIQEIGIKKRNECKNCLILPETPEEIALKKDLQKRIKIHIKEVLRKADKQKIPMEIPEAFEIATKEIIEEEVTLAMENARKRMKSEALRIQEDEKKKKEDATRKEIEGKARREIWAILTLQKYIRIFLSRKRLRLQAYKRYERFFHIESHQYYYQDKKTKETFWEKPQSLGSYDVPMDDYWILIAGKTADGISSDSLSYYYNPSTWEMSWIRPLGTTLCDVCQKEFAKIHYNEVGYDQHMIPGIHYCLTCFQNEKIPELLYSYHISSKDIYFQQFNGGQTTSLYLDFTLLPTIDYYSYSMEINPLYKASEEEEMLSKYQEELEEGGANHQSNGLCENCFKRSNEIQCLDCNLFYCEICNKKEHKLGNRKNHKRITIQKSQKEENEDETDEKSIGKSHHLKFPSLQKTSSLLLNAVDNFYDSDDEEQQEQNYESDFTNTDDYTSATEDGKRRRTGEKKKRKKKKLKKEKEKKSKTKKLDASQSAVSDISDSEVEKPTKKKKKTKKLKKDKENSLSETDDAGATKSPDKKKKKAKKAEKDATSDSGVDSNNSNTRKAKKSKNRKPKTKSTSDNESEDSPKRLILPPINQRPNSTSAIPDDSSVDSPKRYSKSAGDPLNPEKKKKKKVKKDRASVTDDSQSEVEPAEKKPKKKKKKSKETAGDTSASESQSKPKKKIKKPKNDVLGDNESNATEKKKKKKPKNSKSDASDNEASSLSESSVAPLKTPKKKKLKVKKKETT
jgi:hypothetical protein